VSTILVTGATDGLGRALAARAVAEGWDVLAHGRSAERLAGLEGVRPLRADLASLDEVAALAGAVGEATDRLDVLVSNAGIGSHGPREVSADGHELRFAVNYLAGYALIRRLLPLLRASAPARIVQVASAGQAPLDFRDVMLERGYDGSRAYAQSKLAQIMLMLDLAEELDPAEVTATALHPATYMPTKMVTEAGINPLSPLEHGVDATWRLVADPELDGVSGVYFDGTRRTRPHGQALDPDARAELRELSRRLTGV
jgi:NAD(P)-dependent dehydrogenase (short-subunit alcohol dehydrogenase family)